MLLFEANVPNQIRTVRVPVLNDSVALEPNLEYEYQLLGISDTRVQLGAIATTILTIIDDDGESTELSYLSCNI